MVACLGSTNSHGEIRTWIFINKYVLVCLLYANLLVISVGFGSCDCQRERKGVILSGHFAVNGYNK